MLSMEDNQQVLAWSERQQGKHISMASIVESSFDDGESLVERSGTGIRAEEKIGSRPPLGLLACALPKSGLIGFGRMYIQSNLHQVYQPGVRKPTWH